MRARTGYRGARGHGRPRRMKLFGVRFGAFLRITVIAIVGILLAKWALTKVKVPGLSAAVQAV